MNFLKSIFISTYLTLSLVATALSVRMLVRGEDTFAWGGVVLTSAPLLLVISWLMVFRNVARTSARFPWLNVLVALGTVRASWAYLRGATGLAPMLAVADWLRLVTEFVLSPASFSRYSADMMWFWRYPEVMTTVNGIVIRLSVGTVL